MNIEEFMQRNDNVRLEQGRRWMYFDEIDSWVVLEHRYGAKRNTTLYQGGNLNEALFALKNGE